MKIYYDVLNKTFNIIPRYKNRTICIDVKFLFDEYQNHLIKFY